MSIQAITLVLDFAPEHWNSGTRLVAIALADRVGTDNTCWPSITDIARRSGLSYRHVKRTLKYLEAEGIIGHEVQRRSNGTQRSNLWIWLWTMQLEDDDRGTPASLPRVTPTSPWL